MHPYIEKPGDTVVKQFYPNGAVRTLSVLKDGAPANGWIRKCYYPNAALQQEENYSNGLLIEQINYDEIGVIISHKIYNNRLKQLINRPAMTKLRKPNVVTGYFFITDYLKHLPAISAFIGAEYKEDLLLQSYKTFRKSDQEEGTWRLQGKKMSFSIYWEKEEDIYQWHCHCVTEELYWKTRSFFEKVIKSNRD